MGLTTLTSLAMSILKRRCAQEFMGPLEIILIVLGVAVGLGVGIGIGVATRKRVAEREIGSAEAEATRIINEAIRSGESRKKEMLL